MPVNREKFAKGATVIPRGKLILEFLQANPSEAFAAVEIAEGVDPEFVSRETDRRLIGRRTPTPYTLRDERELIAEVEGELRWLFDHGHIEIRTVEIKNQKPAKLQGEGVDWKPTSGVLFYAIKR